MGRRRWDVLRELIDPRPVHNQGRRALLQAGRAAIATGVEKTLKRMGRTQAQFLLNGLINKPTGKPSAGARRRPAASDGDPGPRAKASAHIRDR